MNYMMENVGKNHYFSNWDHLPHMPYLLACICNFQPKYAMSHGKLQRSTDTTNAWGRYQHIKRKRGLSSPCIPPKPILASLKEPYEITTHKNISLKSPMPHSHNVVPAWISLVFITYKNLESGTKFLLSAWPRLQNGWRGTKTSGVKRFSFFRWMYYDLQLIDPINLFLNLI